MNKRTKCFCAHFQTTQSILSAQLPASPPRICIHPRSPIGQPANSRPSPPRAGSRLFSQFQLPTEIEHLVWGRLCQKYAYQETANGGAGFRPAEARMRGAFRHVNESWVFILEPETCSCWPSCSDCVTTLPGSRLRTVDRACLRAAGLDPEAACRYMFVGVNGGGIVFPYNSTGVKPLLTGEPKLCFQYATIRASLVRTFATMMISHPEWQGSFTLPKT